MADINSVLSKILDAQNEALDVAGLPHLDLQISTLQSQVTQLQGQVDALTTDNQSKQQKLDQLKALAQARKDADAAKVDGQDELDLIG